MLSVEVEGISYINSIDNVTLNDEQGDAIETFPVSRGEGLYSNTFYTTFTPSSSFRTQISGKDNEGNTFVRVQPTLYTLEEVELSRGSETRNSSESLYRGELHHVPIKVENIGRQKALYFRSSDDKGYVQHITPASVTMKNNSIFVATLYLRAPVNAAYGETTTVTVSVSESPTHESVMDFLVFYLTVASKVNMFSFMSDLSIIGNRNLAG